MAHLHTAKLWLPSNLCRSGVQLSLICTWFCFIRVVLERLPAPGHRRWSAICAFDAGSLGPSSVLPFQSSSFQAGTTTSVLSSKFLSHQCRLTRKALVCSNCSLFTACLPPTPSTVCGSDFSFACSVPVFHSGCSLVDH
jgi:hypothetical protein